ncbi:phage head closure protein [Undibacterium sp. Di24W]|uniref:phage head closure protein n=1 Tax=Undibacterium sp. Di24W TaxID=3413033 RepID=UPI003BF24186
MNAGRLNRRITIQSFGTTQDAIGQEIQDWSTFAQPWANIRFLNGVESVKADAEVSVSKVSIRIRYRQDITEAMRIVYNGITYQIKAVLPDEAKRDHVDLACEVVK